MPICPKCRHRFRVMADEDDGQHACPFCGYDGHDHTPEVDYVEYVCDAGVKCRRPGQTITVGYDRNDRPVFHSEQALISTPGGYRHYGCPDVALEAFAERLRLNQTEMEQ